jgi:two-component system chemotaxis response regulator CheB
MVADGEKPKSEVAAVAIGGSAGSVEVLLKLLPALPGNLRAAVIVVVHVPPSRPSMLPHLFETRCAVRVREPIDKEPIAGGTIWIAPPDYHLLVERDRTFALSIDEPVHFSRPSIDVLFESAADVYGPSLACFVLTGASEDGARGARAVRDAGGFVIVQAPETAEAPMLPRASIARAEPQRVHAIDALKTELLGLLGANS